VNANKVEIMLTLRVVDFYQAGAAVPAVPEPVQMPPMLIQTFPVLAERVPEMIHLHQP
jgi:hypothetical protein